MQGRYKRSKLYVKMLKKFGTHDKMAFFSTLISTVLKMLFIGVFAVGGVFAGKKLRKRKDAKNSETK